MVVPSGGFPGVLQGVQQGLSHRGVPQDDPAKVVLQGITQGGPPVVVLQVRSHLKFPHGFPAEWFPYGVLPGGFHYGVAQVV